MSAKRLWIVLAAVLLIAALTAVTVIADPFGWASSEDGVEYEEWIGTVDTVIGDDPDEPGYTGEVVTSSGVLEPSEGPIDLETLPAQPGSEGELRPDEVNSEALEAEPQLAGYYYDFSAGATMRPRASLTNWEYDSGGCIHPSKGYDLFTLPLDLPQGASIDYLRLYFYDTSTTANGTAFITIYDGAGGIDDLISVSSVGSAGYGYAVSDYVNHVVDNVNYAYVLNYSSGTPSSSVRLCGLRVMYYIP
ncbi:MAG TPA: hypothetical protein PKL82_06985 [Anaerolineaceae bacterium]|jgi:hypothetical protein|nr:hypothetical protein [Anaerolineaceae bacterium]HOA22220.1 hypothetical protein [Anaerolineaceae bacterium]